MMKKSFYVLNIVVFSITNIVKNIFMFFYKCYNLINFFTLTLFSYFLFSLNFYWLTIVVISFISLLLFFLVKCFLIKEIDRGISKISNNLVFPINFYINNCKLNLKVLENLDSLLFNYSFYTISRNRLNFIVFHKKFMLRDRNFSSLGCVNLNSLFFFLILHDKFLDDYFKLNLLVSENKILRRGVTNLKLTLSFRKKIKTISLYYVYLLYIFYSLNSYIK